MTCRKQMWTANFGSFFINNQMIYRTNKLLFTNTQPNRRSFFFPRSFVIHIPNKLTIKLKGPQFVSLFFVSQVLNPQISLSHSLTLSLSLPWPWLLPPPMRRRMRSQCHNHRRPKQHPIIRLNLRPRL